MGPRKLERNLHETVCSNCIVHVTVIRTETVYVPELNSTAFI